MNSHKHALSQPVITSCVDSPVITEHRIGEINRPMKMTTANWNNPSAGTKRRTRRRTNGLLTLILSVVLIPALFSACAQDQKVPKVAPRPANTLVMLPDGSTVHVELAKTEAERQLRPYGAYFAAPGPRHALHPRPARPLSPTGCTTARSAWTSSGWTRPTASSRCRPTPRRAKAKPTPARTTAATRASIYVLELPVGSIKAHQLAVGQTVNFNAQ